MLGYPSIVQLVVGNAMAPDVIPHLPFAPVGQRVDFEKSVCLIPFDYFQRAPGYRLLFPQSGDPGIQGR